MCGPKATAWLSKQILPEDELLAVARHLREFDQLGEDPAVIEGELARSALAADRNPRRRLPSRRSHGASTSDFSGDF